MKARQKSSTSKFHCDKCGEKKSPALFPSLSATTCTDCLENARSKPAEPPPAHTQSELFVAPDAELDYGNPTAQELASRMLARRRLLHFIKRMHAKYIPGWVHEDICRRLERFVGQVEEQKEPRLLLCMPVRHGKSDICSRHLPAWVLGHHPEWEIIAASGSQPLAMSFSRYLRDLMSDPAYAAMYPDTKLDPNARNVENWNTTRGGGYFAAGVGTMIVGRGAHILLVDDPVRDAEEADSQTVRDKIWDWYISAALSRLAPGGGVLVVMCMTGDTPVMMADGTQRRLDSLKPADEIATYANGVLASTTVRAIKSNGLDSVLKMTTSSGKVVRANQRHPFLTVLPNGGVAWVRLKNLKSTSRIVTVKGSGANGEALHALPRGAATLPCVADYVENTIGKSTGHQAIVRRHTTTNRGAAQGSNTATASRPLSTTQCTSANKGAALFAVNALKRAVRLLTGKKSSQSTTTPARSEPCSATTATPESDTLELSRWHWPPQHISDFTLDEIISIEPCGEEEVFDLQVEHTENFIANGLVSHNTWWNEDDLAGRLQRLSEVEGADTFEVVKYPAINDQGDEYILADDKIVQVPPGAPVPAGATLTRPMNTALHPVRYSYESLIQRKNTYYALGQQRWWAALYQQNPVPEEGAYFTRTMFREYASLPPKRERQLFQAWDFAITASSTADYTVGITLAQDTNGYLYVVDRMRFRADDSFIIVDAILDFWERHGSEAVLGFEDGQIWKSISAPFKRRCDERKLFPSHTLLKPLTDKLTRAQPLRGLMQAGRVWFPDKIDWAEDLRAELLRFNSGGKHDDQVDALAWAVRLALMTAPPAKPAEQKLMSWKDRLRLELAGLGGGTSHMAS